MRLTFLGTGTSFGVPQIGCSCAVCRSTDPRDKRLAVPTEHAERAIYVLDGAVRVEGAILPPLQMLVVDGDGNIEIVADGDAHLFLCGGAPLDDERVIWWNFVASDAARIERGKSDWLAQRFGQVPGETEFIPLPER